MPARTRPASQLMLTTRMRIGRRRQRRRRQTRSCTAVAAMRHSQAKSAAGAAGARGQRGRPRLQQGSTPLATLPIAELHCTCERCCRERPSSALRRRQGRCRGNPRGAPGIRRARKAAVKDVLAPYSTMPPDANTHPTSTTTCRPIVPVVGRSRHARGEHPGTPVRRTAGHSTGESALHNVTFRADGQRFPSKGPRRDNGAWPQPQCAQPRSHNKGPADCEGVCKGNEDQTPHPLAEQARSKHTGLELHCCFRWLAANWQGRRSRSTHANQLPAGQPYSMLPALLPGPPWNITDEPAPVDPRPHTSCTAHRSPAAPAAPGGAG